MLNILAIIFIDAYLDIFRANQLCFKTMQGALRNIPKKSCDQPLAQIEQVCINYQKKNCYFTIILLERSFLMVALSN